MKKFNKMLSVLLSLVLCAGLVSPAFAASFKDLQDAIDGTGGTQIGDTGRYGYAETTHEDGSKSYGIEAWQSDRTVNGEADGQTRYVKLNENVEYDAGKDADNKTITISADTDVTLDLNGKDINATGSDVSVIKVEETGALTLNDSTAKTKTDEDGNEVYVSGKITGPNVTDYRSYGTVLSMGTLTMNGGAISGTTFGSVGSNRGSVYNYGGTFTMNGGEISHTTGRSTNICVGVYNDRGTFTMNGGKISDNYGVSWGGGVYNDVGTFTMNGGVITDNEANAGCGIINGWGTVNMVGGAVWNNYRHGRTEKRDMTNSLGTVNWSHPEQETCAHDNIVETTAEDGTKTYTCSDCGMSYSNPYGVGKWTETDPTCAAGGSISYQNGEHGVSYTTPDPKPVHTPGEPAQENVVEARPGVPGSYDLVTRCTKCDVVLESEHVVTSVDVTLDVSGGGTTHVGETIDLTVETNVDPEDDPVVWESSDPTVATVDENGKVTGVSEGTVTITATVGGVTVEMEITVTAVPVAPSTRPSVTVSFDYVGGTTRIEDEAVPLAGLISRADVIGYLWQKAGSPEAELSDFADVPEDHEWAVAIGWAQQSGIAVADEDGNFRPDDLVLRSVESLEISPEGELQEFLNRYAVYAGIELDEGELFIELAGSWDDAIMGEEAQEILNDFFARLEEALADIAA